MTEFSITDDDGLEQCTCGPDELCRLLADASRRQVVASLETCEDDRVRIEQLAQRLSQAREEDTVRSIKRELHHVHLPMLEETGLIEYDRQEGRVRYYHCDVIANVLAAIDSG